MSKVERKEYMESRSTRTMTPTRMKGSNPNLSEFDNNLDNLLDDLQSTVSRPGSALAVQNGHVRESSRSYNVDSRSSSLNRSTNPVEYATDDVYSYISPDGTKNVKTTRKETYSYRTGGIQRDLPPERVRMQNNINQLDSLLDDLQHVKQNGTTFGGSNQFGQDPGYQSFSKNKVMSEKRIVERDISGYPESRIEIFESPIRDDPDAAMEYEEYKHRDYNKEMTTSSTRTIPSSKTSSLNRTTKMSNIQSYPLEVVETTTHDINPEILANLDPELLPSGNTKVTTTIKTYTYEIPGGSGNPTDIISPNATLSSAHSTPSKSFVYNSANSANYSASSAVTRKHQQVVQPQTPPSPKMTSKFQAIGKDNRLVQSETVTTRNYQPSNVTMYEGDGPNKRTYVYNETTLTRNDPSHPPAEKPYSPPLTPSHPQQPSREVRHVVHDNTNTSSTNQQHTSRSSTTTQEHHHHHHHHHRSPSGGRHSPYLNGIEPEYNVSEIIETFESQTAAAQANSGTNSAPTTPPANAGKPHPAGFIYPPASPKTQRKLAPAPVFAAAPSPPIATNNNNNNNNNNSMTTVYKYSSTTSTQGNRDREQGFGYNKAGSNNNTYYYNPNTVDTQVYPRKFPVDQGDGQPPRDVKELMKNIGAEPPTSPYNAGYIAHETELAQQRKTDQLRHQKEMEQQRRPDYNKEQQLKSRNVTGPPVYYPPGHEIFARKEEGGAWRAEGEMAKASGKYKYEAESKSKSKSSSGAAIVPVCLPLCCGLPCTIL